jgi:hypothetical protein
VDQAARVDLTDCAADGTGDTEKPSHFHGLSHEVIEGLATGVVDNQHRLAALLEQFQWL